MAKSPVQLPATPQVAPTPTPKPADAPAAVQTRRIALEVNDDDIEAIALYAANMNPDQTRRVSQMVATVAPELAGPKKMPNGWVEITVQLDPDTLTMLDAFREASGRTLQEEAQEMIVVSLQAYLASLSQATYVDQTPAK